MFPAYWLFHGVVLLGPLIVTQFRRFRPFWASWPALLASFALVSVPWVLIDALSHARGWWAYNPDFVGSFELFGLPIEEVLFFFTVPLAALFIWWTYRERWGFKTRISNKSYRAGFSVIYAVGLVFLTLGLMNSWERTVIDAVLFLVAAAVIMHHGIAHERIFWYWSLTLGILFLVFNTILTALPIVTYDESFMTGYRIGTIPIEDLLYNFAFLWFALVVYDRVCVSRNLFHVRAGAR